MKSFKQISEEVSASQLKDVEKFADRLLNKFDIDIEFTRHFADRMNDPRNRPAITAQELASVFKKIADNKGKRIKKHGNKEAVLKDMQSDLNLPVVVKWQNGEFVVVNKTIMRKKAFKTPDPVVKYEEVAATSTANVVGTGSDVADWKKPKRKPLTRHYIEIMGKRKKLTK